MMRAANASRSTFLLSRVNETAGGRLRSVRLAPRLERTGTVRLLSSFREVVERHVELNGRALRFV